MKRLSILGSTGSIGVNALKVFKNLSGSFKLDTITANENYKLLILQAIEYNPEKVVIVNDKYYDYVKKELSGFEIEVLAGYDSLVGVSGESDIVLNSIVGQSGLRPSLEVIKKGKDLALANKESLVMAGSILNKEAAKSGSRIIPVDSEHSAIFQALTGEDHKSVKKIVLTASGGPFFDKDIDFDLVKPEEALKHPNWSMGRKISIDSATMMNKGLELIEAVHLFGVGEEKIDVLIHPQSVVHSMVEYVDCSFIAQMGIADMKIPIQFALTFPDRKELMLPYLDLAKIRSLSFFNPDSKKFPAIDLARKAISFGGTYPVVLNGANEVFVQKFLDGKMRFSDIVKKVEKELSNHINILDPQIDAILDLNDELIERLYRDE